MDSEAETTIWEIDATLIDYKEVDWVWNIVFSPDGRTLASASKTQR
jgi:WD40 repeat protein